MKTPLPSPNSTGCSRASWTSAGTSPRSTPLCSASQVSARYIAPGVEVAEAEPQRERARDRALAGPGGPVDRDDHAAASLRERVEELEEARKAYCHALGVLDLDPVLGVERRHGAEHRDPVVAAALDPAAAGPGGDAADPEAVLGREARAARARAGRRPSPRRGRTPSPAAPRPRAAGCCRARTTRRARTAAARRSRAAPRARGPSSRRARPSAPRGRRPARRRCGGGCRPSPAPPIRSRIVSRPVRRGLRLTPWMWSSEPGTSVAATMNGAAEEKSPGTSISPSSSRSRRLDRDALLAAA